MEHQAPGIDIEFGDKEIRIVAQRHARLRRRLTDFASNLGDLSDLSTDDAESLLKSLEDQLYDFLCVFIPDLPKVMPEWEFAGYGSESAAESDTYDETGDHSPTWPQIVNAFRVSTQVNEFDWIKQLGKVIGVDFLKAQLRVVLADFAASQATRSSSTPSPTLPSPNGESDSTSSSPSDPTPQPAQTSA